MTGSSQTSDQTQQPSTSRALLKPVRGAVWFSRTRPWLTGSAALCTLILGLVIALQPGRSRSPEPAADDSDLALLDDVDVFRAQSSGRELRVTDEPNLFSPGQDEFAFEAPQSGGILQAGFTDDSTSHDGISVIRPTEHRSAATPRGQAAWLTGTIEIEDAHSRYTKSTPTRHASR